MEIKDELTTVYTVHDANTGHKIGKVRYYKSISTAKAVGNARVKIDKLNRTSTRRAITNNVLHKDTLAAYEKYLEAPEFSYVIRIGTISWETYDPSKES